MDIIEEATCYFDSGLCNYWLTTTALDDGWTWQNGQHASGVLPQSGTLSFFDCFDLDLDHRRVEIPLNLTGRGFMTYIAGFSDQPGSSSMLQSAPFQSHITSGILTSPSLQLSVTVEFWYYFGAGETTLEVNQIERGTATVHNELILSQNAENVGRWNFATVTFCLLSKDLTVITFRVTAGEAFTFAGLDEIVTHRNSGNHLFSSIT